MLHKYIKCAANIPVAKVVGVCCGSTGRCDFCSNQQLCDKKQPPQMDTAVPVKDSWKFCPACGKRADVSGVNPFRCAEDSCGLIHYFSPNTAVGALIVNADGALLFIVRGKNPGRGKLGLPGGFVDPGETAEESLIREIEEEINLKVTEFRYLASFPNQYSFKGVVSPVTDLFFVAKVECLDGIKAQEGEIESWKFLAIEHVNAHDLAFGTHRQALECYAKQKMQKLAPENIDLTP